MDPVLGLGGLVCGSRPGASILLVFLMHYIDTINTRTCIYTMSTQHVFLLSGVVQKGITL